jgi:hypothetical protein
MSAHRHDRRHDVHRDRRPSFRRAGTVVVVAGAALLPTCTWTRLRNARHEAGSVITTGSVNGAFGFVTVQPGDAFFETRGCAPWHRVN